MDTSLASIRVQRTEDIEKREWIAESIYDMRPEDAAQSHQNTD